MIKNGCGGGGDARVAHCWRARPEDYENIMNRIFYSFALRRSQSVKSLCLRRLPLLSPSVAVRRCSFVYYHYEYYYYYYYDYDYDDYDFAFFARRRPPPPPRRPRRGPGGGGDVVPRSSVAAIATAAPHACARPRSVRTRLISKRKRKSTGQKKKN